MSAFPACRYCDGPYDGPHKPRCRFYEGDVRSETPSRKVGAVKHPETVGPPISALQDRPNVTTCRRCGGTGSVAGMPCSHIGRGRIDFRDAYQREVDNALAGGLTPEAAHELGLFATYLAGKAASRAERDRHA